MEKFKALFASRKFTLALGTVITLLVREAGG